jgi:hypothetical protein
MKMLTKLKSFVVLLFVCTFLVATSLSSCGNKGEATGEENAEHPAGEEEHPKEEKADHPANEEHPKSDSTKVEEQ